jgi:hypothetical protein
VEQLLEMGAHRSVRHSESLRDLLIGQAVCRKPEDLRLAGRQATGAEVGPHVPSVNVPIREPAHFVITRCAENNATFSCAYL